MSPTSTTSSAAAATTTGDSGLDWHVLGDAHCIMPGEPGQRIWDYCPSTPAAVVGAIAFILAFILNIFMAFYFKKRFSWVLIMGTVWSSSGFVFRVLSTRHQESLVYYTAQQLLTILAPLWVNAFLYMVLARMVLFWTTTGKVWIFSASKIGLMFVLSDILTFLIQLTGAGQLSSSNPDTVKLGKDIYMAGVGVQLCFLVLFLAMVIVFHRVVSQRPNIQVPPYKILLYLLYASVILITIRTIYRLTEFSNGEDSYSVTHEWPLYIFDALPIWSVMMFWVVYHPGRALKGEGSEFTKQWKAEKKGRKAEEKMRKKMQKEGAGVYSEIGGRDGSGSGVGYAGATNEEAGLVANNTAYGGYGQAYEMQRPHASYGA